MARGHGGSSCGLSGAARRPRRRVLHEQADQRVEQVRLADRLGQERVEQRLVVADFAPAERAEQHQRQRRRGARGSCAPARRRPSRACACRGSRGRTPRPLAASASASVRRLGRARRHAPLSRLQARARGGWSRCRRRSARACPTARAATPMKSRCRTGGRSATGASIVNRNVDPLPGPSLSTHMPRPSARRGAG